MENLPEITTQQEADAVGARIDEIWAVAEQRWQEGGRPLRFRGCSYYVVDSGQMSDRSAYLTQAEADEVHTLTMRHSLFVNDPARAHARVMARMAAYRAQREAKRPVAQVIPLGQCPQLQLQLAA